MAFHRRRNHYHNRFRSILPVICTISGALLILFALLSFLAPTPIASNNPQHMNSLYARNSVVEDTIGESVLHIPKKGRTDRDIWSSRNSKYYYGCSNASIKFANADAVTQPNRYLLIVTSGGLNQQRTGITDAVVAARILNATLVVPRLDQKSFWKDSSDFSEIFDVDWYISSLSKDVKIIKSLPKRGGKTWIPRSMRVPRKCSERCYQNRILPVLLKRHAIQLTKFDYRVANRLDTQLQKLRCRVNYHALKFTDSILQMGGKLVHRMRMKSKHFIALHLRFEPDMLAFSGCYYGGGDKERKELGAIRKRWKTLHVSNPDKERRHGKCPLTPREVGLMLRALGYSNDVHIYVASGEVYGGEETLAPLKALFPNFYTKETLASKEELEPFSSFSSRMAALDFIVCDESDVFVTNNNGNMARILAGRRRYFGHKPTIRPNAKKLYRLFLNQTTMSWEAFASKMRTYQRGFMGEPKEVRPGRGEFHENPHTCICEDSEAKAKKDSGPRKYGKGYDAVGDDVLGEDEPELSDPGDDGYQNGPQEKDQFNGTGMDYDGITNEEPELEEILSD
ncbi:O-FUCOSYLTRANSFERASE 16 [Salix koriyanagi]|uniref:O-fucosyltransferase family protein n=1 Tax=Salix koriyanagi TaxID=2511006 RepID=A0A9Q0QLN3_9ROSI|nr:O-FUCOSYLTRANSFERASE 16 [Salix koriyanagi]